MTATPTTLELRREAATAYRDRDRWKKEHDRVCDRWTADRTALRQRLKDAQRRERILITLLTDYLAGEFSTPDVHRKLNRGTLVTDTKTTKKRLKMRPERWLKTEAIL